MIYIQSNSEKTAPHHFDAAAALFGGQDNNQEFRYVKYSDLEAGKYDNLILNNLFVGSADFMTEVFKRKNITVTRLPNSDREHTVMTIKQVRELVASGGSIFVKPFQMKLFTGIVIDAFTINTLKSFDEDMDVMTYPVLPQILSEWRLYVFHNTIVDARNYSGDFKVSPNYVLADKKVKELRDTMPCAYVMDVGICEDKFEYKEPNVIIEFNDMYAIGNYGMENSLYYRMLRERYFEIIRTHYVLPE